MKRDGGRHKVDRVEIKKKKSKFTVLIPLEAVVNNEICNSYSVVLKTEALLLPYPCNLFIQYWQSYGNPRPELRV